MIYWTEQKTDWGTIILEEEEEHLLRIHLTHVTIPAHSERRITETLQETMEQIDEYLSGHRRTFQLPFRIQGTPFQRKVWNALREIPYGTTLSYKSLAEKVGSPRGYRAVGMANHRNPFPLIIPCHRVVGTDGSLVGFAAGLAWKRKLLALEQENKSH